MNILPKKSWHVKSKKNIERVHRDEAEAERLAGIEQDRILEIEKELRARELRERTGIPEPSQSGHINLFEENPGNKTASNRDHEEEKRLEEEKWQQRVGIVKKLVKPEDASKPWYCENRHKTTPNETSRSSSTSDDKRQSALITSIYDPMTAIKDAEHIAKAIRDKKRKERDEEEEKEREREREKRVCQQPVIAQVEGCRSSDLYEKLLKIGEGTYGAVYKARCRETNEMMALKKLKLESETEGFPITSIREAITLSKGKHPNVIDVKEIVFGSRLDQIYIVMEFMDRDLKSLMHDMKRPFKIAEVKLLMQQLISAIAHLHNNWILHRDLKTSNLLINKGVLKVGDFGLAREYGSPLKQYTNRVVTLWYRAPELLLQTGKYSTPIDVWSIGCIFGELLTMKPLFPGESEPKQLDLIFKSLGSPNEQLWPDYERIKLVQKMKLPVYKFNRLLEKLSDKKILSDKGFHFWNKLLAYDPGVGSSSKRATHRITAEEALRHEFFLEDPRPLNADLFPTWPSKSHTN